MVRAEKEASTSSGPHRRKRVIALIVLCVVVLLIWSMPYLVSSGVFDGLIFSAANDQLNGTVHWQGLSLSWLGPCRVEQLVLTDAQGRTLADVDQIEYSGGLWHAIWSPLNFGTVSVRRPLVTVYVDEPPQPLLAPKPEDADEDEEEDEDSGPAKPIGTVAITEGRVRLVRADNSAYELTDIGATLTLQTLNDLGGKVHVGLGGGGAVSMELQLTDLLSGGDPSLKTLVGSVKLASDEAIQLGPLTAFIDPAGRVDGAAGLRIDAALDKGKVDATVRAAGKGLRSTNKAYQTGKPIDVSFSTVVRGDEHALNSDVTLAVAGSGSIWFKAAASEPGKMQLPAGAALLAAVLEGKNVTLPNVTLTGGGEIHLAPIAQAVPSVLNVLPEVSVQSGTLTIESFSLTGGVAPEAAVSVTLSQLSARKGQTQLTAEPVSLDVRAALRGGQGLVVTQANLASTFATLTGSGTPEKMALTLNTDLAALRKEMGQVFDLSALPSAGTLTVAVNAAQPPVAEDQPRQIEMALRLEAMGIEHAWKDKHLSLGALSLGASVTGPTDFHTFRAEIQSGTVRGLSLWGTAPSPDVMDLTFGGQVTRGEKRFDAEMDLAGDVHPQAVAAEVTGKALLLSGKFGMEMPSGEAAQETAAPAGLMAYLFEGRSPAAPQFDVKLEKATGRIDVPALLRALPALATSFEPWAIHEAVVTLERADLRGGTEPSAGLAIRLYPLRIRRTFPALKGTPPRSGQLVLAQPWRILLTANAGSDGLRIQTFALQEKLADAGNYRTLLDASFTGPARQPVVKLTADLTALHSRLRPILGADVPELAGSLESSTTLTRTPQGIEFDGKLSASGLVLTETPPATGAGAPVPAPAPVQRTLGDLRIAPRGSVTLAAANNELTAFKIDSADIKLGKDLSLNASGGYEVSAKRYQGTVVMEDVRIAPLLAFANAAGAGVEPGASYGGSLTSTINVEGTPEQMTTSGNLAIKDLAVNGSSLGPKPTTLKWTGVVYQAQSHRIAIARAAVGGPLVDLLIEPLTVTTGEALAMDGSVTLNAVNLGPIWPLVQPRLERARQRTVIIDEDGNRKKPGPLPITLEGLVRGRVTMTPKGGVTTIRTVSRDNPATAAPLTITNLRVVADNGAQWKENITLQAVARLNPADKTITIEQVDATTDPIASAATTAPAVRTFELHGGNIRIEQYDSDTEMLIRTGTADFQGDLGRLQTVSAALAPSEPGKVQQWLGKINPIFAKSSRIEGVAVLDSKGIAWPRDVKRHAVKAAGSGTLTFNDFRITPKGLLAEILKLGGPALQDRMPALIDPVTFVIRDGKVHCDNFVIHFGKDFDLRFSGDVGLDDSLDLKLSLPVSAALLEKYGVRGPALEYFTTFAGERLTVPIRGTTSKPAFKVTLADLQPLIQRGLQKGLLNKVLDNVKKPDAPAPNDATPNAPDDAENPPAPATKPASPEERIKDTLLDLLRQQMNKGNDNEKQ